MNGAQDSAKPIYSELIKIADALTDISLMSQITRASYHVISQATALRSATLFRLVCVLSWAESDSILSTQTRITLETVECCMLLSLL